MHTTLGETAAAGAIQPEGAVIFARLRRFQAARRAIDPRFKIIQLCRCAAHSGSSRRRSYNNNVPQVLEFRKDWRNLSPERGMDQQNTRAAVVDHIDIV